MVDLTSIAYTVLGLTSVASAVRLGHWLLNAPPRTIIRAGRWLLLALAVAGVGVLVWLIAGGRWTVALLLATFLVPLLVRGALRWQHHLYRWHAGPTHFLRAGAVWRRDPPRPQPPPFEWLSSDPEMRSRQIDRIAIRLAETRGREAAQRSPRADADAAGDAPPSEPISKRQALDILGLAADASPAAIDAARRRLVERLRPERGGSAFLVRTVNEAHSVLVEGRPRSGSRGNHVEADP